ncbi:hypothetical protein BE20_18790 [Sorangium cellulosum]|nr:hypothetical protein BE20_18790 [Sorangium cellulosum]
MPGDHGLAEARGDLQEHAVGALGHRVDGEQDAGELGRHHPLHHDGDVDAQVIDAARRPVGEGPRAPEGCPAPPQRDDQRVLADHVEVRLVLARERGVGEVLRRRRGAHRDRRRAELAVGVADRALDPGQHRAPLEELRRRRGRVLPAARAEVRREALGEPPRARLLGIRARAHHEPGRYREPEPEQLTQVGSLAARGGKIGSGQLAQAMNKHQAPPSAKKGRFPLRPELRGVRPPSGQRLARAASVSVL